MPTGSTSPLTGFATTDLGLGGQLSDEVKAETEEEKKKRLRLQQMSPGAAALLGGAGGMTGGRY